MEACNNTPFYSNFEEHAHLNITEPVLDANFSSSGNLLAVAVQQNTAPVQVWDVNKADFLTSLTYKPSQASLTYKPSQVSGTAFIDATQVVSAHKDRTLHLWDIDSGQLKGSHDTDRPIECMKFNHKKQILVSSQAQNLVVCDLRKPYNMDKTTAMAHNYCINSIAIHPDGNQLACACINSLIHVWDLRKCQKINLLNIPGNLGLLTIDYNPNGEELTIGHEAGFDKPSDIYLYNFLNKKITNLKGKKGPVNSVHFISSQRLAVGAHDGFVGIYDTLNKKLVSSLKGGSEYGVRQVLFNSEKRILAATTFQDGVRLWNVKQG